MLLIQTSVRVARILAALVVLAAACATAADAPRESFDDRDDLSVLYLSGVVGGGVSGEIAFEVPYGVESMLIEVRGASGRYYLAKLVTPLGRDLVEAGQFVTRGARELPGVVTWLYPNTPGVRPDTGTYRMIVRAEDGAGGHIDSEYLDVRVYLKETPAERACSLRLDFLVADDAIVAADVEPLVRRVAGNLAAQYATVDVHVQDHTTSIVHLPTADLDIGGNPARVIGEVGKVMDAARDSGLVRSQALHILLVRSLGSGLRGYSMGLPGPMGSDLPTSAVLVSSRAFTGDDGYLDPDPLAETVAHEVGHYLGLYHTSESDRQFHDPIADTAECTEESCPPAFWDNLMSPGGLGRTVLSPGQGEIIRRHPLCIPGASARPDTCDLTCEPPDTCAVIEHQPRCARACDPSGAPCPDGARCVTDDLGKYICETS